MPTIKQLIRNTRQPIRNVTKSPALGGCPQRRGTCTRVYVRLVQTMTKERKQLIQYHRSVPVSRIKWTNSIAYSISKKKKDLSFDWGIKCMVPVGANPTTSILNLR